MSNILLWVRLYVQLYHVCATISNMVFVVAYTALLESYVRTKDKKRKKQKRKNKSGKYKFMNHHTSFAYFLF